MSFFKRFFFKRKEEEDFETVLATLASDIQKRQVKLSEIRLREKRSALLATVYALLGWFIYTSLWYWNVWPSFFQTAAGNHAVVERIARGLPVFVGPIIILFIRRIVVVWYTRKVDAEEKTLQSLMKQRRTKVDEIKKKTNFDSMVKLFEEYDEPSSAVTPLRRRLPQQHTPITPQRYPGATPNSQANTPRPVTLQSQLTPVPSPFPLAPPKKKWYDKVADAILGDDDHEIASPSSRYALICERCFTHNGLVKESMWEDAQFICRNPNCNYLNRSVRSKRQTSSANSSPSSPTSPLPDRVNRNSPSATPSPRQRTSLPNETGGDNSDLDAPTVDSIDAGVMEVDS